MVDPIVLNSSCVSPTTVEDCASSSTVLEERSTAEANCRLRQEGSTLGVYTENQFQQFQQQKSKLNLRTSQGQFL